MITDTIPTDQEIDKLIRESEHEDPDQAADFSRFNPFRVEFKTMSPYQWEGFIMEVNSMPATIKQILTDANTAEFIISLCEIHDLTDEQATKLSVTIRDILMGKIFIGNMTQQIQTELSLEPGTAKQIRDQIVRDLFAPAIEDIKKIQQTNFTNPVVPKIPVPQNNTTSAINPDNIVDLRNQS